MFIAAILVFCLVFAGVSKLMHFFHKNFVKGVIGHSLPPPMYLEALHKKIESFVNCEERSGSFFTSPVKHMRLSSIHTHLHQLHPMSLLRAIIFSMLAASKERHVQDAIDLFESTTVPKVKTINRWATSVMVFIDLLMVGLLIYALYLDGFQTGWVIGPCVLTLLYVVYKAVIRLAASLALGVVIATFHLLIPRLRESIESAHFSDADIDYLLGNTD